MRRGIAFLLLLFAWPGLAEDPCRARNYYESLKKKPLVYWVYSATLARCILTFSGNGLGGVGEGQLGANGSGKEGLNGSGSGSGGSSLNAGSDGGHKSVPQTPSAPSRNVAGSTPASEFEIIFHGAAQPFKAPPVSPPKNDADSSSKTQDESQEEKIQIPDLS